MPPSRAPSAIGVRLRRVRDLVGLGARELDRLAEITEGHTSLIESGVVQRVTADIASQLARPLGLSLDWLIEGKGPEPVEADVLRAVETARERSNKPAA